MIVENENPKIPTFLTLRQSIRANAQDFAKQDFKSFSRLVEVALLEYMRDHVKDIKRPLTLNVINIIEQPKTIKELCEIAHCKNPAGTAQGIFKEKTYKLCKDHEGKYSTVKGWLVT